ncbi:phage tail tape measure protein [Kiritimatiellaeota bacterium B1221]|nr:phage tail tape measure protein [Kiritimatiellaeota bacterium B1221]
MAKSGIELKFSVKNLVSKSLKKITSQVKKFGSVAKSAGRTASKAFKGIAKGILAVGASLVVPIRDAQKFRKALAEVTTLTGGKNIKEFRKDIKALASEFGFAKDELAGGLYKLISAGIPKDNAIDVLRTSLKMAVGGVTTIDSATRGLTAVINSYGIEAEKAGYVSDVLFSIMKNGDTTVGQISDNIGTVAGLASQAGVSLESLGGAIATLTKGGKNTSIAMTEIRAGIVSMLKPSADLQKSFAGIGTTASKYLSENGLQKTFQKIYEFAGGSADRLAKLVPEIRAMNGVVSLTGEKAKMASDDFKAISESLGATEESFKIVDSTRQWEKLLQNVLNIAESIGNAVGTVLNPALDIANKYLSSLGDQSAKLEKVKELIKGIFSKDHSGETFKKIGGYIYDSASKGVIALGNLLKALFVNVTPILGNLLIIGFLKSVNVFAKGMNAVITGIFYYMAKIPSFIKASFDVYSNKNFWVGIVKVASGAFVGLGTTLMRIFEGAILVLQAGMDVAIQKLFEGFAKIPGLRDAMGIGKDFKAQTFDEAYEDRKANGTFITNAVDENDKFAKKMFTEGAEQIAGSLKPIVNEYVNLGKVVKDAFNNADDIISTDKLEKSLGEKFDKLAKVLGGVFYKVGEVIKKEQDKTKDKDNVAKAKAKELSALEKYQKGLIGGREFKEAYKVKLGGMNTRAFGTNGIKGKRLGKVAKKATEGSVTSSSVGLGRVFDVMNGAKASAKQLGVKGNPMIVHVENNPSIGEG